MNAYKLRLNTIRMKNEEFRIDFVFLIYHFNICNQIKIVMQCFC